MVPANKNLIWGAVVIVGGIAAALLFRRESTPEMSVNPQSLPSPSLPRRSPPLSFSEPTVRLSPLIPGDFGEGPAASNPAKNGGEASIATDARNERSTISKSRVDDDIPLMPNSMTRITPAKRHVLRDGDTLAALAQRYLGDAGRADEIFEFNRHLLKDPNLLPIGKAIQIPSGGEVTVSSPTATPRLRPLPPPLVE